MSDVFGCRRHESSDESRKKAKPLFARRVADALVEPCLRCHSIGTNYHFSDQSLQMLIHLHTKYRCFAFNFPQSSPKLYPRSHCRRLSAPLSPSQRIFFWEMRTKEKNRIHLQNKLVSTLALIRCQLAYSSRLKTLCLLIIDRSIIHEE